MEMSTNHSSRVRSGERRKLKMPELLLISVTIKLCYMNLEIAILSMTIKNCQYLTASDPQKWQFYLVQLNIIHIALKQPGKQTDKNHPILPEESTVGERKLPTVVFCLFVSFHF